MDTRSCHVRRAVTYWTQTTRPPKSPLQHSLLTRLTCPWMLRLHCKAQNYEWGREAGSSEVAQLAKANGTEIDESKPFAELWMGTHPNCPSVLECNGQSLQAWIEANPLSLGTAVLGQFGATLPFLFKVLSVRKALSIQSHPDKKLAERLHRQHPKLYPDNNHKPEMALALADFEALCGFCPLEELQQSLTQVPELALCVGEPEAAALLAAPAADAAALKAAFTALMTCDQLKVQGAISSLVSRLEQQPLDSLSTKESLALRLNQQYPGGDVGVLSCFFLNLITLTTGQAIYLPANVPHAYLSGELMECMAASDNVIRAGLTPKFKDTEVLCSSLVYEQGLPDILDGKTEIAPGFRLYQPPFEEFEIHAIEVPDGSSRLVSSGSGPQLLMVQHGAGRAQVTAAVMGNAPELIRDAQLGRGSIFFVPAGVSMSISAQGGTPMVMWAAAVNSAFLQLSQVMEEKEEAAAVAVLKVEVLKGEAAILCPATS